MQFEYEPPVLNRQDAFGVWLVVEPPEVDRVMLGVDIERGAG
jgi:hypothetical protein